MTRRLLCLSDIHDDFELYTESLLPDADAVLIAGDFTNRGDRLQLYNTTFVFSECRLP
ncbi:MAG: hypothetical protein EON58_22870 [Alphaproteobacteria bacterium]|nr:MAG: hypothetical protein EON58_22870 [Alphaproteobacteria bacterium]